MNLNQSKSSFIIFLGDSLTEGFDLHHHFGRNELVNMGISGNLTDHVIYRMEAVASKKPQKVFLMIGITDLFSGRTAEEVYRNTVIILDFILEHSDHTQILVQSVLPVNVALLFEDGNINTIIYRLNQMLEKKCESDDRQTFLNLHPDFLNTNAEMDMRYTFDGIHLSEAGYVLWAKFIKEYL